MGKGFGTWKGGGGRVKDMEKWPMEKKRNELGTWIDKKNNTYIGTPIMRMNLYRGFSQRGEGRKGTVHDRTGKDRMGHKTGRGAWMGKSINKIHTNTTIPCMVRTHALCVPSQHKVANSSPYAIASPHKIQDSKHMSRARPRIKKGTMALWQTVVSIES